MKRSKLILLSALVLVLVAAGLAGSKLVKPPAPSNGEDAASGPPFVSSKTPSLDYQITPCQAGKSPGSKGSIEIDTSRTETLKFDQKLVTYCNADETNLKLSLDSKNNVLTITETFDAEAVAKCTCPAQISGAISNLESGQTYQLRFVFKNNYTNKESVLDEIRFTTR